MLRKRDAEEIREGIRIARLHGGSPYANLTVMEHAAAGRILLVRAYSRVAKQQMNREYSRGRELAKLAPPAG